VSPIVAEERERTVGSDKDMVVVSWDVESDLKTVQDKWVEFTTAPRYAAGPSNAPDSRLSWVWPKTEGEAEQVFFEEITPATTKVSVMLVNDEGGLPEAKETFADVSRRVDEDMGLFKDYVEGRLPKR
jgi:hypothetical protein